MIVDGVLPPIERAIGRTFEGTKTRMGDVDVVLLTGGSSQLQRFRQMVQTAFPLASFVEADEADPITTVAAGLGRHAWDRWSKR